jgi:2-aminobenzoate-CoA ligase
LGRIPSEYLPPREAWPERVYSLPELCSDPASLNSTEELLDRHVAQGRGHRAAMLFEDQRINYAALSAQVDRPAGVLRRLGILRRVLRASKS